MAAVRQRMRRGADSSGVVSSTRGLPYTVTPGTPLLPPLMSTDKRTEYARGHHSEAGGSMLHFRR